MADLSDKAIDRLEKDIEVVLAAINVKISRLVAKLESGDSGLLDKMELARARATRRAIVKEFAAFDSVAMASTNFAGATKAVKERLKPISVSFTQSDASIIKLLSDSAYRELGAAADQTIESVNMAILKGSMTGAPISEIQEEVTQLLIGGTDKAGRSMAQHAKTITQTRYMEADAAITLQAADNIGADKFRYSGSLIKDSRPWCKDHVDKLYTRKEIEEWRDRSWAGKKEGDPFITRGGWNCRHYFVPVIVDG
jgi:hypothetical protein